MYCANCGVKNVDESKFCTECGHRLLRAEAMPATVSEASHARILPWKASRGRPPPKRPTRAPIRISGNLHAVSNRMGMRSECVGDHRVFRLDSRGVLPLNSWSPIVAALVKTFGKVGLIPFTVAFAFITLGLTFVTLLPLRLLLSAWRSGAKKS